MSNMTQTLFVGIDVSKDSNQICALSSQRKKLYTHSFKNNQEGANSMKDKIIELLSENNYSSIIIVLESTGVYSTHIANFLSSDVDLLSFDTFVYLVNPKIIKNYHKSFIALSKNDPNDSFVLAEFAVSGRTSFLEPFKVSQHFHIQTLTRQRKHYVDLLAQEKVRILNFIFLKFSDFNNGKHNNKAFSNTFGNTSIETILSFKTPDEIVSTPLESLVDFVKEKSKNRFDDCESVAKILKKAARDSYRLDKVSYNSININLAVSFSVIKTYNDVISTLDKEISSLVLGCHSKEFLSLTSIPGVANVYAAAILSEIGSIDTFPSDDALANYAGIVWKEKQSGNYTSQDTSLSKAGNTYLRYYLVEATRSVIHNNHVFQDFYSKKLNEVSKHKESRALVLTSRKFIRLIFKLLKDKKLYQYPNN